MLFINKQKERSSSSSYSLPLSLPKQVLAEPVEIVYGNGTAKLTALVQPVRSLCSMICDYVTSRPEVATRIPCGKGCSDCCNYLVPVGILEAAELAEEVERFPEKLKDNIKHSSLRVSRKILENHSPQGFPNDLIDGNSDTRERDEMFSKWYKALDITCPFLYEAHCLIYEFRPLSCRQYFVTGPACRYKSEKTEVLHFPVNLTHSLAMTVSEFEPGLPQAILLPFIFPWYQDNRRIFEKTYPEQEIARVFAEKLTQSVKTVPLEC